MVVVLTMPVPYARQDKSSKRTGALVYWRVVHHTCAICPPHPQRAVNGNRSNKTDKKGPRRIPF